jgi:hypothetical protein
VLDHIQQEHGLQTMKFQILQKRNAIFSEAEINDQQKCKFEQIFYDAEDQQTDLLSFFRS